MTENIDRLIAELREPKPEKPLDLHNSRIKSPLGAWYYHGFREEWTAVEVSLSADLSEKLLDELCRDAHATWNLEFATDHYECQIFHPEASQFYEGPTPSLARAEACLELLRRKAK